MFPVSHWVNWEEGTDSGMDVTRGRRLLESNSDRKSAWEEREGIGEDLVPIPRVSIGYGNEPISWCVPHSHFHSILIHAFRLKPNTSLPLLPLSPLLLPHLVPDPYAAGCREIS